jgi:hypothetical protein
VKKGEPIDAVSPFPFADLIVDPRKVKVKRQKEKVGLPLMKIT